MNLWSSSFTAIPFQGMGGTSCSREVSTMSSCKASTMSCYKPVNYVPERFGKGA